MVIFAGIVLVVGVVLAVMSVIEKGKRVKVREGESEVVGEILDRLGEVSINKKAIPKAVVILIVFTVIAYQFTHRRNVYKMFTLCQQVLIGIIKQCVSNLTL